MTNNPFASENISDLNIVSYSSKKEKMFSNETKKKLRSKHQLIPKVKYIVSQIDERQKVTASPTYNVKLKQGIGSGKLKTEVGVAKKQALKDNASAQNLGISNGNSGMLSRQVASWRIARSLNLRVLSNEKYGRTDDNELVGISAMLPSTAKSLNATLKEQVVAMKQNNLSQIEMENYLGNTMFSGTIQKQLSDLQLLDALTGQTDRHHGNIFIDVKNQRVYGIDNDQAFGQYNEEINLFNALASFKVSGGGKNTKLEFIQDQIDVNTAEKILALDGEGVSLLMKDTIGRDKNEFLTDAEIDAAKERLTAIKERITHLKENNKLITNWGGKTYFDALNVYGGLAKEREDLRVLKYAGADFVNARGGTSGAKYRNYIAREVNINVYGRTQGGFERGTGGHSKEYEIPQKYHQVLGKMIQPNTL